MITTTIKKAVVGTLLTGGIAFGAFGLAAGVANAQPSNPGPTIDNSDFGVPIVECIQCQTTLPSNSIRVNPALQPGNIRVAVPAAGH